jgi:hypothetical protein
MDMGTHYACKEIELLMDRLVSVENALFFLQVKSKCLSSEENLEEERLEKLRRGLHKSYEQLEKREMAATRS